ncbi:LCP family protein [Bacillus solimangrovi]|nr:LCP family protein [Bacillus solimangrovi]
MDTKQPEKKHWNRWVIISLTIIGILIASSAGYALYLANLTKSTIDNAQQPLESRVHDGKSNMRTEKVDPRIDNISILFLGIDDSEKRGFSTARSDAMILATFNETNKSVKMVNIPRDSRVKLAERNEMDKITHAHAFGGIDMAVNTVENLFDIPVDYYVRVNFDAFIEIVDAMDGIEIDVPFDIVEQNSKDEQDAIHIKKGLQTLNGEEALAYVRTRKYDSDLARGQRQQEVLKALLEKSLSIQSITKYDDVLKEIGKNLTTNMRFGEMAAFHDYLYKGKNLEVELLTLEGQPDRINRIYYYVLDEEALNNTISSLKAHLELEETNAEESKDN